MGCIREMKSLRSVFVHGFLEHEIDRGRHQPNRMQYTHRICLTYLHR